jgi:short-subunit dehydrogenase involved in D-alanine esterification of teichoic acids
VECAVWTLAQIGHGDRVEFDSHVVVITGGSRGLGRHMVRAFADAGANVVVAGRNASNCQQWRVMPKPYTVGLRWQCPAT